MKERDEHVVVNELVPWFVNGTLSAEEASLVERHVRECLTCYAEVQRERRLGSLVRASPVAPSAEQRAFDSLMSEIDGKGAPRAATAAGGTPRSPRRARVAAGLGLAASVLVIVGGAVVWSLVGPDPASGPARIETLTEEASGTQATRLDIVFAATVQESRARRLFAEIGATVVAGPTELGRYTVELESSLDDDELAALLEQLRRDERIRFVGRSFIAGQEQ